MSEQSRCTILHSHLYRFEGFKFSTSLPTVVLIYFLILFILVHAKMGTIKDRNGMDLTAAEDINKMWQEYTKELYKKDLHHPDNHDGVITHLCQTPWNVKSSGPLGCFRKHHYEQS